MNLIKKPLGITDVVLRDAHQSLFATRMRTEDMLPIASKLDQVGYWSVETWGGATFDACIRYLGEDPWERIRLLKKAMPNTPQQMLLRGQNLLGYRHYADDVVNKFVERAAYNGVDVFRIFDAMNDVRNLQQSVKAVIERGKHAQGTISYTLSPVHNIDLWVDLAKKIEDTGVDSIAIKDMAGLLKPYVAYELVSKLKESVGVPIHMQCHATTGLSTATALKAIEAGIDNIDTSISSMSMTYGHSPTESVVSMLEDTDRATGLDIVLLEEIASYFRKVRKKYAKFEGALRGVDSRILVAQVPGGMLTNMEGQLAEQGVANKMDEVLEEIPRVRKDLGYIPLVTPTSQIVGTQAVLNVLTGERYKTITKETAGVLKGEYGKAPADVDSELRDRVLDGSDPITCRPADILNDELDSLQQELEVVAKEKNIKLADSKIDDVLIYALFPQIGLKYLENRNNPEAFEAPPSESAGTKDQSNNKKESVQKAGSNEAGVYTVKVNGSQYVVEVTEGGEIENIQQASSSTQPLASTHAEIIPAPLAGNIFKVLVQKGQVIQEGDVVVILEAMKMETEVRSPTAGTVGFVSVQEGDSVSVGDSLFEIS